MDRFTYRDGVLYVEDVAVEDIAARFGTPVYVYSHGTLVTHLRQVADAFADLAPLICFSVKALSNIHLLRGLAAAGAGVDVVSGGELYRALLAGVPAQRIVFAGVGKSDEELRYAVRSGIRCVNVESEGEMRALARAAAECRMPAGAAVRVNPDVAVGSRTPAKTTTGRRGGKFGIDLDRVHEVYRLAVDDEWLRPEGLHFHLGSPVFHPRAYGDAVDKVLTVTEKLTADGAPVPTINIGGGFPADYEGSGVPGWSDFAAVIAPKLRSFVAAGGTVVMEPGRSIAANAGVLLASVRYLKTSGSRNVVITDTGMSHLIRTAFYDTFHFLWPARPRNGLSPVGRTGEHDQPDLARYDVAGPLCESSDYLAKDRLLPSLRPGDVLAIFTAGAYGMTMASHYNSLPRPAEVLVDGGDVRLIRRRETYEDLVSAEVDAEAGPAAAGTTKPA
ncbi:MULTISPECIES: diaminopimelate decarboxylase [Protofrankia]|uniref:Diaminopimelate decarboxylase n=1 Tax=Candidatus Protofrankia datiscae TaxID=2716812 RepID=F8B6J5_9ACTN|nr:MULTISPECIES: diaminopimelate decarboxylase [Protofrankia]AEH09299.1 diaminopimelate decarboxylase [Candidatus Protofrankia datiscae]